MLCLPLIITDKVLRVVVTFLITGKTPDKEVIAAIKFTSVYLVEAIDRLESVVVMGPGVKRWSDFLQPAKYPEVTTVIYRVTHPKKLMHTGWFGQ